MTRVIKFSVITLTLLGTASAQQQWGPPAQSRYYHNPGNPPTYMAYNTSTTHAATQPAVSQPARSAARKPTARPVAHRTNRATPISLQ